jgi:hypothetical protein
MNNVIDFFEGSARAFGYRSFAELEAAEDAAFNVAMEQQQRKCMHGEKHPDLGMCEPCAGEVRW